MLRGRQLGVDACVLRAGHELAGRVLVTFTITRTGRVQDVRVASEIQDAELMTCIAKTYGGTAFPESDSETRVSWPIDVEYCYEGDCRERAAAMSTNLPNGQAADSGVSD